MKTLFFLLAGIISSLNALAQYVPTKADIDQFYKSKTYVVMEKNPMLEFNLVIKDVMSREWKLTDVEYTTYNEFAEKLRFNPNLSFLVMTQVSFDKDNTGARYKFLHVLLGSDANEIKDMPEVCSVPIAYRNVEEQSYIYKLSTLLRFIQNHIELINNDPSIISSNVFKHYNKNINDISSKTLYLVKDELAPDVNTIAKIKKVYPFKFKLATREEIGDLVVQRDPNAVFLHKVGPEGTHLSARCYKIIVGAADAKFYYFDYHMINKKKPDGLLKSDFKKMGKGG
jgi:hypothetical protein